MTLMSIDNSPMPYAWGSPGGISKLLGRTPQDSGPEAELWLGSHVRSPSRVLEPGARWENLRQWEEDTDQRLPFLLKILNAAAPLSLQVHPSAGEALRGFHSEEAAGIPRESARRNYRDPHPKPEMVVALNNGFEALCGFREPSQIIAMLQRVQDASAGIRGGSAQGGGVRSMLRTWEEKLSTQGLRGTMGWLLSGELGMTDLVHTLEDAASMCPEDLSLVPRLLSQHPGDAGAAVALMLNHETLRAGEGLWLPAGNIHAYLCGAGVELMGPSDNVLRGGLTSKHIDTGELLAVLDAEPAPACRLEQIPQEGAVTRHRAPRRATDSAGASGPTLELLEVTGDSQVETVGPNVIAVLEGEFTVESQPSLRVSGTGGAERGDEDLECHRSQDTDTHGGTSPEDTARRAVHGDFLLSPDIGRMSFSGSGRAFVATGRQQMPM